ncbi:putative damage-inducible protein DinB [Flavobacterium sp. W4I14]|nr:putative damage-inducible protein DinB [Flavobacterium sp. W4I14]
MLTDTLKTLFNRDLNKLKSEIESYKNEANLWIIDKSIANSAGNLCLHLIGNLNTYIGATLGGSNYIRNRELEFSLKDVLKQELINMIEATIIVVNETLGKITEEQLNSEYPMLVFQEKTSTEFFLVHLTTHLAYHLGQVNYHRRLLDV